MTCKNIANGIFNLNILCLSISSMKSSARKRNAVK